MIEHAVAPDEGHARNDNPPHGQRTGADDGSVFQSDDISQTQYGRSGIHLEYQLGFLRQHFAEAAYAGGEILVPPSEGGHDEVVKTADDTRHQQRFRLAAAFLARYKHLRRCGRFGEGVFAVHVAYEIFTERDKEKNTQHTAQQRADEYLRERYGDFLRIAFLQDIQCGQGKDGACHDYPGTGSDGLDDDVFAQRVLAFGCAGHADGDDGDRDGRLEYLSHFQSQIGCRRRKQNRHGDTPQYRPEVYFGIFPVGAHQGVVDFSRL